MKKYTQPTVEITAFDFEDIMTTSSMDKTYSQAVADGSFTRPADVAIVNVQW